jgi:cytochrome b pre-mRNA-processing protein 3
MLRLLFPRLTAEAARGAALFQWVSEQARASHWYLGGDVSDTVDGRFAMLATIAALAALRLEQEGEAGAQASVALTERFIEVMESEHREMGLGDPKLGRTVRKLVGSLARRVAVWRAVVATGDWQVGARDSVYAGADPSSAALLHTAAKLNDLWLRLESSPLDAVAEGRVG